jgi:hypothetical protein
MAGMGIWVQSIPVGTETYRVLCADAPVTDDVLSRIDLDKITGLQLHSGATRSRAKGRFGFLERLPNLRYLEIRSPRDAALPPQVLSGLEVLVLTGRVDGPLAAESLRRLRSVLAPASALPAEQFAPDLESITVVNWGGSRLSDLPFGPKTTDLLAYGLGQLITVGDVDGRTALRKVEVLDVVVESLAGIEQLPNLWFLSLLPSLDGDVRELREVDLRPLVGMDRLARIRVGRQGPMRNMDVVARLPHLKEVFGYRSFFPPEYRDAPWANILDDPSAIRRLIANQETIR